MKTNKIIIIIVGKDTVGIIAKVYTYLADNQINVLDISQTIVQDYFNVVVIVDAGAMTKSSGLVSEELERAGEEIGVKVKIQRKDIFTKMHRIRLRFKRKPAIRCSQGSTESFIRKGQQDAINIYEVNETNNMIEHEKLDACTITLDVSLLDYAGSNLNQVNENIYRKTTTLAKGSVIMSQDIERDFGVSIVSKCILVTLILLVGGAAYKCPGDFVTTARTLDKAAKKVGANFVGGYSALVSKGITTVERNLIFSVPQAFAETEHIYGSISVGSTKTELNVDAVEPMGRIVRETAEATKDDDSLGYAKLVVFCNAPDDNPFTVGTFHGVTGADVIISVGVSGPGVVEVALEETRGGNFEVLCEVIKKAALKIMCVGQLMVQEASRRMRIPFGITDLFLAPTPSVGDSVAGILGEIDPERVGVPGTTAALAMLNNQVKKGGVVTFSYVGGLSGAFIPVNEDQGMIDAVSPGALTLGKLEAMTCVCSVGLNMIAISSDTLSTTIAGIIVDEVVIGMINRKTTTMHPIPMIGKKVGDTTEFSKLLGCAPTIPVNTFSCRKFVTREGRIPAPIHSSKNWSGGIHIKLCSVRHGRQCSKLCNVNVSLNEEGYRQASLLGERLFHGNTQVVYSSNLLRAMEATQAANLYWNVEHIIRPELREISFGDMEGMIDEATAVKYQAFKERQDRIEEDILYPGGECASSVVCGAEPAFMEMARSGYKRIAVMTHGGVIRSATAHCLGIPMARWRLSGSSFENCSIAELYWNREADRFLMERLNDYVHLQAHPELLRSAWMDAENQSADADYGNGAQKGVGMEKGIIFDVDGALWDAAVQVANSWDEVLPKYPDLDVKITAQDMYDDMGKTMDELGKTFFPSLTHKVCMRLMTECMEYENRYLLSHPDLLYPDVKEALIQPARQYKLFIISNCQRGHIGVLLKSWGLEEYIRDRGCFGDTRLPRGDSIRMVVRRNHLDQCLYAGDTAMDQAAAAMAGIPFVHTAYGYGRTDRAITSLEYMTQLPGIAEQLLG